MLIRKALEEIKEYVPGKNIDEVASRYGIDERDIIKLSSNENPYPPSKRVIETIKSSAGKINLYPYNEKKLYAAVSEYIGLPEENVFLSAGADGVLDTLMRVFIEAGDRVIIPIPTFSYYEITSIVHGAIPLFLKMDDNFSISSDEILKNAKRSKKAKMTIICSPNNPTGNIFPKNELIKILDAFDGIVILDEAYAEFSNYTYIDLVDRYDNLIVLRTLSKAFGIAGMRVGYALLPEWIKKACLKVATPFSIGYLSIEAAYGALNDLEYLECVVDKIKEGRRYLEDNIPFKTFPSEANFVLVDVSPLESSFVMEELMKKGLIVRDCSSFRGVGKNFIRISVGREVDNRRVVDASKEIFEELH
ncbi:MAG: Aspartate aminotransferase [Candidatus Methanolliviera sp. GoM_asphalt]|nr:MAG: Aspartate aminotransferase [Candidatus Methanolliviera sp. GoM_asphalt]